MLFAICVLHVLMNHENVDWRNFHFFRHTNVPPQLFLCTTVTYKEIRLRVSTKVCSHFSRNSKAVPGDSPVLTAKSLCTSCTLALRPVNSSLPPLLQGLHCDYPFQSRLKNAASHPSYAAIAAQVRAAHNRLLSLCRYFVTSFRVGAYQALLASCSTLSLCLSFTLLIGLLSARFFSASSSSSPWNIEGK